MDIWGEDKPTARALLEQINYPFQINLAMAHTEWVPFQFELGEDHLVGVASLVEHPMTTESVAKFCKVDVQSIRDQHQTVTNALKQAKQDP